MTMFVERAELPIAEGKEADFAAAMASKGTALLAGATGCSSARVGRGVENPGKFILLLEWDSVESHVAFTTTPEFDQFKALAGPFFAGAPSMEHFDMM
jgi:heme-degrading monooxygenase HmoA